MANRRIEMPEALIPYLRRLRLHARRGRSPAVIEGLEQLLQTLDQQGDWLTRLAELEQRVTRLEQERPASPVSLEQVRSPTPRSPHLVSEAALAEQLHLPRQQLKQLRLQGQRLELTWQNQPVIAGYSHRGGKGGFHLWRLDPVSPRAESSPPSSAAESVSRSLG